MENQNFQKQLEWFRTRNVWFLFLFEQHFLSPLVAAEREKLEEAGILCEPSVQQLVQQLLPPMIEQLPQGIYFPIPIAKAMEKEGELTLDLAMKFHYEFIIVDEKQKWFFKGKEIECKVKDLFVSHLFYESSLDRYFIEYQVDNHWDKCYLECRITPMIGLKIDFNNELQVLLNNSKIDQIMLTTIRVNSIEQCFCQTMNHGEILFSDNARFALLQNLQEDGESLKIGDQVYTLTFAD